MALPRQYVSADPAPALSRGLQLLALLNREGLCSLERLSRGTGWPKSSVVRLLASLDQAGAIRRDPASKRYQAIMRLVPLVPEQDLLRSISAPHLLRMASSLGHTIELHAYHERGLTMVDRCEPEDCEVRLRARIGWNRDLAEFDALTQVVVAFDSRQAKRPTWYWNQHAKRQSLKRAELEQTTQKILRRHLARDLGINDNGVRRYAAPVLGSERQLRGVLVVAQVCTPGTQRPDPRLSQAVQTAARQVTDALQQHRTNSNSPNANPVS